MNLFWGRFNRHGEPLGAQLLARRGLAGLHVGDEEMRGWREGPVGFGMRVPPADLAVPEASFPHAAQGLAVVASARLDNRPELLAALGLADETPDSQLILSAYRRWGEGCPEHLLGSFGFAIWDGGRQRLFCARDHLGFRPFYYALDSQRFVFASEIRWVLTDPDVPDDLDELALGRFLLNEDPAEDTAFLRVKRLTLGSWLSVDADGSTLHSYWHPERIPEMRLDSDEAYAEGLRSCIADAVSSRLQGPRPVAVSLSGGLDSSTLAVLAARELRTRGSQLEVISSALPEGALDQDERPYIETVCAQEGLSPTYVLASGATPFEGLDAKHLRLGEPLRDAFHYMTDALHRRAADLGVGVILNGFGGDFLASFKGRGIHSQLLRQGAFSKLLPLLTQASRVEGVSVSRLFLEQAVRPLVPRSMRNRYRRLRGRPVLEPFEGIAIDPAFAVHVESLRRARPDPIDERIRQHARNAVHDDLLSILRMPASLENLTTSAEDFGVEIHIPLLDKRVVEFCLSVPLEQFLIGGWRRSLMRRATEGILPSEIRWRPGKDPFTPDFARRMASSGAEAEAILDELTENHPAWSYLDRGKIEAQLDVIRDPDRMKFSPTIGIVNRGLALVRFLSLWRDGRLQGRA